MKNIYLFLLVTLIISPVSAMDIIRSATKNEIKQLKKIDDKYSKAKSLLIEIKKEDFSAVLENTKAYVGQLWVKKGKLKIHLESNELRSESDLFIKGMEMWLVNNPLGNKKAEKMQIARKTLSKKEKSEQGLLTILNEGGILGYFDVYGVIAKNNKITYYLHPKKKRNDLVKGRLVVNKDTKEMEMLSYQSKEKDKTTFIFGKTQVDLEIEDEVFNYTPPKGANVMSM